MAGPVQMSEETAWRARPMLAASLYALIFGGPVVAGIVTGSLLIRVWPRPDGWVPRIFAWLAVTAIAMVVVQVFERLTRRLLPLAAMLKLSLIFPDRPPKRFGVALRGSNTRRVGQIIDDAKRNGLGESLDAATGRVLELVGALNVHDRRTRGHSERVRALTTLIAEELRLPPADQQKLQWAALLHDVGKLLVHTDVLNKAGKPTDEEWELLRSHPVKGAELIGPLREWLGPWADTIEEHHEAFDGTGYPRGRRGHEISYGARIVAVADTYDVIVSARSYKPGIPAPEALAELSRCAGRQFDPAVVRAFLSLDRRRLRWAMGPLSGLANVPALARSGLPELGNAVTAMATVAGVTVGAALPRPEPPRPDVRIAAPVAATEPVQTAPPVVPPTTTPSAPDQPPVVAEPAGVPTRVLPAVVRPVATTTTTTPPIDPQPSASPVAFIPLAATTDQDTPVSVSPIDAAGAEVIDPTSIRVIDGPSQGSVSVDGGTGTITYTPFLTAVGADTFTYEACSTSGSCSTGTVSVAVAPVPGPTAVDDEAATAEASAVIIDVLANDTGTRNALVPSSVRVVSDPSFGAVAVDGGTGRITYTPWADRSGADSFRYEVCDLAGRCATAEVVVTVAPIADRPVAGDDAATTSEDVRVLIDVAANDTDVDGDIVPGTLAIVRRPGFGTATVRPDNTIEYTPDPDANGVDTFTYTVADATGLRSAEATVTVTVTPVNDAPVAAGDSQTTAEDTPVDIDVLANDHDVDGNLDPATLRITGAPTAGSAVVQGDWTIRYSPNADSNGIDSFTYEVCDTDGLCTATTVVALTVVPVNDAPVASDDSAITQEDLAVVIRVVANDVDVDSAIDPGSVSIDALPANGAVSVDGSTGDITYTPNADFNGTDSFRYMVCDAEGDCSAPATVTVTVTPVNDAPTADPDSATLLEDSTIDVDVATNDTDVDGNLDPTAVRIVTPPTSGTATVLPSGLVRYTPAADFAGTDTLTYEVCDTDGSCAQALLTLTVDPVEDAPIAFDDTVTTPEDTPITFTVTGNDSDAEGNLAPATVLITSAPLHGVVSVDAAGRITYTPAADWNGTDVLQYTVADTTELRSAPATVTITVTPAPDGPEMGDIDDTVDEDVPKVFDLLGQAAGGDNPLAPGSLRIVTPPSNGTVTLRADGTARYVPNLNYNGPDSFTYEICDTAGLCATGTARLDVQPQNDPPVAGADSASALTAVPITINVLANDSDVEGNIVPGSVAIASLPANGTATANADGTITYRSRLGFVGTDTFTYQVCDTDLACAIAAVTVNVLTNQAPIAAPDVTSIVRDTSATVSVLANDTDPNGNLAPWTLAITQMPDDGTATVNRITGTITYTPKPGWDGVDVIRYTICDTGWLCSTTTLTVTVTKLPPTAVADVVTVPSGVTRNIAVLANDLPGDDNIDASTLRVLTPPTNGTATRTGSFIAYTSSNGYIGPDSLTYEVCDGKGLCSSATVTITVVDNLAPIANDDLLVTNRNTVGTLNVSSNDVDPEGLLDKKTVTIVGTPTNGTATYNPSTMVLRYSPNPGFVGTDTITYTIRDEQGNVSNVATVNVSVIP